MGSGDPGVPCGARAVPVVPLSQKQAKHVPVVRQSQVVPSEARVQLDSKVVFRPRAVFVSTAWRLVSSLGRLAAGAAVVAAATTTELSAQSTVSLTGRVTSNGQP